MSGISTGIGLISGIDTASLIEQLIAFEARPIATLRGRVAVLDIHRTALLSLSAQLLAVQNAVANMDDSSFFRRFTSQSSNASILTAQAGEDSVPGTFSFRVRSVVSNQSVISRGFADADATPIGVGSMSIEIGNGRINDATPLDALHGQRGVRRGSIRITDRTGETADIDLSHALTVDDILSAINSNTSINVRARVTSIDGNAATGDRIVIEDLNTFADASDAAGPLSIVDLEGGFIAQDLGIAGVAGASDPARVDGIDLIQLTEDTPLALLNDGNGIGRLLRGPDLIFTTGAGYPDFNVSLTNVVEPGTDLRALNGGNGIQLGTIRITDRAGESVEINLADPDQPPIHTVGDVLDRINDATAAAGVSISATVINSHIQVRDASDTPEETAVNLKIEDVAVGGVLGSAAADLGIAGDEEDDAIIGRDIYRMQTVGDVIRAINFASGNDPPLVRAGISADGNGLTLTAEGIGNTVTVTAGDDSTAAEDLGLAGATFGAGDAAPFTTRRLIAGLNTVLLSTLNGGSGVGEGDRIIELTDGAGQTSAIDLTAAKTLQDVIDLINQDTATGFRASINAAGTGIVLRDESGGADPRTIRDVTGSLAGNLNIDVTALEESEISSGNLQRQYIARQTPLSQLGAGRGFTPGTFRVSDSLGFAFTVTIFDNATNVGDVLDAIGRAANKPDTIEARINDNGDGIIFIDTAGGDLALTIEDLEGGRAAADLNIARTAVPGQDFIDGSFEMRIQINAGDTLNSIALKINELGGGVSASVVNDGGSVSPFSLTLASQVGGLRGSLVIDTGDVDLGFSTLSEAADAVLAIGGADASNPLLVTSSTNTFEDMIEGVTLQALSVSDELITVSITQDVDGIVASVRNFVDRYNDVQDTINAATRVDEETNERGIFLGDRTVDTIRRRLQSALFRRFGGENASVSRLFSIGIRIGTKNRIEFDEDKFRESYAESTQEVERLFTTEETGFGDVIEQTLENLTRDFDGLIARRNDTLEEQQELLNDRIDDLNGILDAKRSRLEAQFIAMEQALAGLQGQQNALAPLFQQLNGLG